MINPCIDLNGRLYLYIIKYQIHRIINKSFVYRYFFIYTFIETKKHLVHIEQSVNGKHDNQIYILHIFKHDGNTHLNLYQ